MGNFGGIGETEIYERGVYLSPGGSYELEVMNILLKDTRKSGLGFIVEFRILQAKGEGESEHAPGSKATWFQKMTDPDVALPTVKSFMIALMQVDMKDKEAFAEFNDGLEATLDEITEPVEEGGEHPLKGERIHCDTHSKLTKKGADFTVHTWGHSQQTDEELAA